MNDFTIDFVDKFHSAVEGTSKANKNRVFKSEATHKYFKTIQALNYTGGETATMQGNQRVEDYEIPEILRDLMVPKVTLSGAHGETSLLEFKPVEDKDVMSPHEFNTFGRILYGLYRKDFQSAGSAFDILNKPVAVANYSNRITDVNGQYVGDGFEIGQYPLKPKYEFLAPEGMGMEKVRVEDRWIRHKVDDLASK